MPPQPKPKRPCRWLLCAAAVLTSLARPLAAQVLELKGGTSTLFNANGGSVQVYGPKYTGRVSLGFLDTPRIGFFLRAPFRHWDLGLGDQAIPFILATDLFSQSYYVMGRGLSVSRKNKRRSLFIFTGATSRRYTVPFFDTASADSGAALIFYQQRLSPTLRFFSHNVFASRQTSIQGVQWKPREKLVLAAAGGMGSNQQFGSSSLEFADKWISLRANYTEAGNKFQRIRVVSPVITETNRENLRLDLTPRSNLRFSVTHQNYLSPAGLATANSLRATVNGFSAGASTGGFNFYGALFGSASLRRHSQGISWGVRRSLGSRLDVGMSHFRSASGGRPATQSLVSTVREILTRRLSLSQVVSRSGGQTSIAFGGRIVSNRLTLGVDYQTVFLPFTPLGRSQFQQVAVVNLQVRLPGNILLAGSSQVDPLGKVRYTAYTDAFVYHRTTGETVGPVPRGTFAKYVIQGRVVDEKGEPVSGAALKIGSELVFTDSQGVFFLRLKKAKEYPLEVLLDQFMFPGSYEVVSVPKTVKAGTESRAENYKVVLRRVR